jgi:hypothetical protein
MSDDDKSRIAELEDEIRQRDRRLSEVKDEMESERDLAHRLAEQVQESSDTIEAWKHCFEMVPNEEGVWEWQQAFAQAAPGNRVSVAPQGEIFAKGVSQGAPFGFSPRGSALHAPRGCGSCHRCVGHLFSGVAPPHAAA